MRSVYFYFFVLRRCRDIFYVCMYVYGRTMSLFWSETRYELPLLNFFQKTIFVYIVLSILIFSTGTGESSQVICFE